MARAGRMLKPLYEDFHKLTEDQLIAQYKEADAFLGLLVPVRDTMYKKEENGPLVLPHPLISNKMVRYWLNRFYQSLDRVINNLAEHRENLLMELRRRDMKIPDTKIPD
jgi:hypothetical protein